MPLKILYLFSSPNHGDYIADYLLFGLRELDHDVIDYPKRLPLYEDSFEQIDHFYRKNIHRAICGRDPVLNRENFNIDTFDLIIAENAGIFLNLFNFWNTKENQNLIKDIKRKKKIVVSLLGNDTFWPNVMPTVRYDKNNFKMAIREKCFQPRNIKIKKEDFPLFFTIKEENCKYIPSEERIKDVFFSMAIAGKKREKYAKYYENKYDYKTFDSYFEAIRKHKYGITIYLGGFLCQRDPELGGNTLLCRLRKKRWNSPDIDYKDGKTCLDFSNIRELRKKMNYYNKYPQDYGQLLKNCYNHTVKYFTCKAQARRLVEWVIENN